jgi:hypothetical protein
MKVNGSVDSVTARVKSSFQMEQSMKASGSSEEPLVRANSLQKRAKFMKGIGPTT